MRLKAIYMCSRRTVTFILLISILTMLSLSLKSKYFFNCETEISNITMTLEELSNIDAEDNVDILSDEPNYYEEFEELFAGYPCPKGLHLLILVISAPENFDLRKAIRKSWADERKWNLRDPDLQSKTLFLIGQSNNIVINMLVKNENYFFGDILIGEYLDSYRNLTIKVMHGFSWAHGNCQSHFVLKTDDDAFVNVPLLQQFLQENNPSPVNLYAGRVYWSSPVIRDPDNQWYVPSWQYPNKSYLPYVYGLGYILSRDVLKKLLTFSKRLRAFPNEDAYVGTVLHLAGVAPTDSTRFEDNPGPWEMCDYLYLFVIHRITASLQNKSMILANMAAQLCSIDDILLSWI